MKKIITILILTIGIINTLFGEEIELPQKISISDKFSSPWGADFFYEYELHLNGNNYDIRKTIFQENEKKIIQPNILERLIIK